MRSAYRVLFLVFLFRTGIGNAQEISSPVLDQKISVHIQSQPINTILDSISSLAQVYFSYDPVLVEAEKMGSIDVSETTLKDALDTLFQSKFNYQVLNDQIIISKRLPDSGSGNRTKSPTLLIKGRITDAVQNEVLPYTGISLLGSSVGTVSNIDGDFELKITPAQQNDTLIFSHLGYQQYRQAIGKIDGNKLNIRLRPTTIQLKEVKIVVLDAWQMVYKMSEKIATNYPERSELLTAFYREVLKRDNKYIDVSEAVMDISKAPYVNPDLSDRVKVVKGRKSHEVETSQFVDFKIQGGPYYITQLDVIKTVETFVNPEFLEKHRYTLEKIDEIDGRKTYVIEFKPKEKSAQLSYEGKLYIDMSTLALIQAEFNLTNSGLRLANHSLIKKKPRDFYVRPLSADYRVSYRKSENKWHLSSARASIDFRVKSKSEKVNAVFHSISDLLITDIKPDQGTHFKHDEIFSAKDIFSETIHPDDEAYWGDYNIIKPTEDLQNALKEYQLKTDSLISKPVK